MRAAGQCCSQPLLSDSIVEGGCGTNQQGTRTVRLYPCWERQGVWLRTSSGYRRSSHFCGFSINGQELASSELRLHGHQSGVLSAHKAEKVQGGGPVPRSSMLSEFPHSCKKWGFSGGALIEARLICLCIAKGQVQKLWSPMERQAITGSPVWQLPTTRSTHCWTLCIHTSFSYAWHTSF